MEVEKWWGRSLVGGLGAMLPVIVSITRANVALPATSGASFTVGTIEGKATPTSSLAPRKGNCLGYVAEITVEKPRPDNILPVNVAYETREEDGVVKTYKGQVLVKPNEWTKVTQWGDVVMTIVVRE